MCLPDPRQWKGDTRLLNYTPKWVNPEHLGSPHQISRPRCHSLPLADQEWGLQMSPAESGNCSQAYGWKTHPRGNEDVDSLPLPTSFPTLPPPSQPNLIHSPEKLEQTIRTLLKKWLKLPCSATQAILYHSSVLAVPDVSSCYTKAKVSYISPILASSDTAIIELNNLIDSPAFLKRQEIPTEATTCLCTSWSSTPTSLKALKRITRQSLKINSMTGWNQKLSSLCVQNKIFIIIEPEAKNYFWRLIMDGMPSGQLSFMVKAESDTLPTPPNLQRYKIQVCQRTQAMTGHILSACPEALEQGRYIWRHDSVLQSLVRS